MADDATDSDPKYRQWLVEAEHTASRDFDRAVMILAGGALGVSLTFIREVAPRPVACSRVWIGLCWVLLVASLLAILVSMLTSQHGLRVARDQADEGTAHMSARVGGSFGVITKWLNIIAAVALVLGLASLVVFALLNYGKET